MSTPFDGTWTDQGHQQITITSEGDIVTVNYGNGRGPFPGVGVTIGSPVLYVDFTDDRPFTGVLAQGGGGARILWSNETVWTRSS